MALTLAQLDEIDQLARTVPRLVDMLASRTGNYAQAVLDWLARVESVLENNRVAAVSQVAANRALLIQAARGQNFPEVSVNGRVTPRKLRDAAASLALQRCDKLLNDLTAERRAAFAEAERIARQIVAVADAKGIIERCRLTPGHQAQLECIRQELMRDPDLAGLFAHLTSLVGRFDVLVVIDRSLT
jgi:hypothetical protein